MSDSSKYKLVCENCLGTINSFKDWFVHDQRCSHCKSIHSKVVYTSNYKKLENLYNQKTLTSLFDYIDFLPLEQEKNIVSYNEGTVPIEEWSFLNDYAKKEYGIDCKVFVCRNDLNAGTHTFKDLSAALTASVLKENHITKFCLASAGNLAIAYSKYLSSAGVHLTSFLPENVSPLVIDKISDFGQTAIVSKGDYNLAKNDAASFANTNKTLMSSGNLDPLRIEAKRIFIFECMRQLKKLPDVYIQSVSGGTGPLSIAKGISEINHVYPDIKLPKMLLIQQNTCDPMVQSWEKAVKSSFSNGYEKEYVIIKNPKTKIPVLSTGNPKMFPILAPIVRKSNGDFLRVYEDKLEGYANIIKEEKNLTFGLASITCFYGFFQALKKRKISDQNTIVLNLGDAANPY